MKKAASRGQSRTTFGRSRVRTYALSGKKARLGSPLSQLMSVARAAPRACS